MAQAGIKIRVRKSGSNPITYMGGIAVYDQVHIDGRIGYSWGEYSKVNRLTRQDAEQDALRMKSDIEATCSR